MIESRWVVGSCSGFLKTRFIGKGFTQVIDKEAKYAHTPQATTLKIILMMSQLHRWSLAVSDVASAFLNAPVDDSKGFTYVQAPQDIQYPEGCLKRQLYGLRDSLRSWHIRLTQVLKRMSLSQMKSAPCAFTGFNVSGHVDLIVMAYVDDLVVSGESASVQRFFQEIQKTFSLKHIDYLTPDHPVEFLGRVVKKRRSGQITMEFSQTFVDNLLGLFKVR